MKIVTRFLAIICIAILNFACGGGELGGSDPVVYSPAPGVVPNGTSASLTVPGATEIYITTDGSVPTKDDCSDSPYVAGTTIPLDDDTAVTIKVLYVLNGVETLTDATYIVGTVVGGPFDGNRAMLADWRAWSDELRNKFPEPSGTGHVGTFTCSNGGTFDWNVPGFFLSPCTGGTSTFTYSNCEYSDANGTTLSATGSITGDYCQDGSGAASGNVTLASAAGVTWTGAIKDKMHNNSSRQPIEPAEYTTSCDQANCADEVKYQWSNAASDWTEIPPPSGGFGCSKPWVSMRNTAKNMCATNVSGDLRVATCDASNNTNQQWIIEESPTTGRFTVRSSADNCVTRNDVGDANDFTVAACNGSATQQFSFPVNGSYFKVFNNDDNTCFFTGIIGGDNIWGTDGNCGTYNLDYEFKDKDGMVVNPTTFQ